MSDDKYGFTWGNMVVQRLMELPGRGRVVRIFPEGVDVDVQVYVSEAGRSIRVWKNGKELTEGEVV